MSHFLTPMLCKLIKEPFDDKNWLFEKKIDGIRCLAVVHNGKIWLYSRNKVLLNNSFPELVKALKKIDQKEIILDGEIVTFVKTKNQKKTSFKNLQNRLNVKNPSKELIKNYPVYFSIFDCLKNNNKDLRKLPLLERKKILKKAIKNFKAPLLKTDYIIGKGKSLYQKAVKRGWEGIIGKKISSQYLHKRSNNWVKIKCESNQEFIIIGYTLPQRSRLGFGALLLGYYDEKGSLHYAGKVGTGFNESFLQSFSRKLKQIKIKKPLLAEKIKEALWVKPKYVAQIKFSEKTKEKKLRHPTFTGLRKDKKPKEIKEF